MKAILRIGVLALALGVSSGLRAEAPAPPASGPFVGLRKGDRVRLVLKSKCPCSGIVRAVSAEAIKLDLRYEDNGIEGTMSFPADLVRKLDLLGAWDEREMDRRRAERGQRLQQIEEELKRVAADREAARKADEEAAQKAAEASAKGSAAGKEPAAGGKEAPAAGPLSTEDLEKGLALLKEFPPSEGWGTAPEKTADWLKIKYPVLHVQLTPAEQKFLDHYDLWLKARQSVEPKAPAPGAAAGEGPGSGPAPSPAAPAPARTPPTANP
jgi:hypothetical protein